MTNRCVCPIRAMTSESRWFRMPFFFTENLAIRTLD
jgi:hypothetical protein